MKKTITILTAIVLMAFAFCGCGAQKEVLSHPKRTITSEPAFSTTAVEVTVEIVETIETIEPETIEKQSEEADNPIWPTTHWLADLLPHTDYITEVEVLVDKPSDFQANVTDLSAKDFGDYKYQLVVCGWETVLTSTDDMFIADHENGVNRVVIHPNSLDKGVTYIHIWEVG